MRRPSDPDGNAALSCEEMLLPRSIAGVLVPVALAAALMLPAGAAAEPAPPSKQVLTVNIGTLPLSPDPGEADFEADLTVQNALFAPLYRSAGGATGRVTPFLAAAAPTVSNGGRRYVVRLRPAKWSDGVAIKAADVKLAFERARRTSYYASLFDQVSSVTAVNASTIRFDLREPVPWFDELLASNVVTPIPSHEVRQYGAKWTKQRTLVSSGPFTRLSTRGRSELVLEKNPKWWGASTVRLRQLVLLAVTEASGSPLFRAGRLDATMRDTSIHPSALTSWATDPRLRTVSGSSAQYLFLNTRTPELASSAVRRGIALALDRAALAARSDGIDSVLSTTIPRGIRGSATAAPASGSTLTTSGLPDTPRAQAELAAGGWTGLADLDLYYRSDSGDGALIAADIRKQLSAVGVAVVLHPTVSSEMAKVGLGVSPMRSGVDMVLQGWQSDFSDPRSFHQLFTCANVDLGLNVANYCDPSFDTVYAQASLFAPFASRANAHRGLEQILTGPGGAMPAIPLYASAGQHLVQKWVRGFVHQPSGRVDFERVSIESH